MTLTGGDGDPRHHRRRPHHDQRREPPGERGGRHRHHRLRRRTTRLTLDLAVPLAVPVSFDGGLGLDTLVGPAADVTWDVTGPDAGTVAGVDFSAVENLTGAPDNHDTFVLGTGGSVAGTVDGGTGGFDSLVFDVDGKTVHSTANDPHSGSIAVGGTPITYAGLEPITNTGTATDMIFDLGALPDLDATLSRFGPAASSSPARPSSRRLSPPRPAR